MRCADCAYWLRGTRTVFLKEERWEPHDVGGKGLCRMLEVSTIPEFGCSAFVPFADPSEQEEVIDHQKEPWEVWAMIPCPRCRAAGNDGGAACDFCAGTGNVRRYADGEVVSERIRDHPHVAEQRRADERAAMLAKAYAEIAALEAEPPPVRPEVVGGSSL